ncbi:MAG: hypothetical protein KF752_15275 [Pirellulaceae bacterium]|nr:hypothetical protein [Pirellulaceae bacterium]
MQGQPLRATQIAGQLTTWSTFGLVWCLLAGAASAQTAWLLQYKLQAGQQIVSQVVHQSETQTMVAADQENSTSRSQSLKVWDVQSVDADGNMKLVYSVDRAQLQQSIGDQSYSYDSAVDLQAPEVFQSVAQALDQPLATITISPAGEVLARDKQFNCPLLGIGDATVPLPNAAVAIGAQWHVPRELRIRVAQDQFKTIKLRESYRLERVSAGVATISVVTQPLTPTNSPVIDAQLAQQLSRGTIKFDIDAGRLLCKHLTWDQQVVGFQGPESSMRFYATWSEELVPASMRTVTAQVGRR